MTESGHWVTTAWPALSDPLFPVLRQLALPSEPEQSESLEQRCWEWLHVNEQDFSRRFTGTRRTEWLLGRIAIKESVRHWQASMGYPVLLHEQIEVVVDTQGAPAVTARDSVAPQVSLAHTSTRLHGRPSQPTPPKPTGLVLAAATNPGFQVGIDVEARERSLPAVDRLLDPGERDWVDDDFGVIGLLVAKEAAAKAAGTGLNGSLRRWPVLHRRGPVVLVGDEQENLRVVRVECDDTWVVGICTTAWEVQNLASMC